MTEKIEQNLKPDVFLAVITIAMYEAQILLCLTNLQAQLFIVM